MTDKEKPTTAGQGCGGLQNLPARTSLQNIVQLVVAFNLRWKAAARLQEHREAWRAQFRPDISNDPVIRTHDQLWELLFVGKVAFISVDPPAECAAGLGHRVRIGLDRHTPMLPLFFVMPGPVAEDFADCLMKLHGCFIIYGDPWQPEGAA
jgi:hypothetical protein